MEFETVVRRRRMVRSFDDRALPAGLVDRLLRNAVRAPSAGFSQGWAFLALEGREQTATFWNAMLSQPSTFRRQGLFSAPALIVPLSHERAYVQRYAEPDKNMDVSTWPIPYWHVDAAFASMLMLLTAVDEGLGALFFGIFKPDAFRAAFGVPDEYTPVGAIAVGYPSADDAPSPSLARGRRPFSDVVHRGRW